MSEYENEIPVLIGLIKKCSEGLTAAEFFKIISKQVRSQEVSSSMRHDYFFWNDWLKHMAKYGIFTVSNERVDHSGNRYLNKGKGPLEHRGKHYRLAEKLKDKTREEIIDVFLNTHI